MNNYAYRVYDYNKGFNSPLFGGTVSAKSMDDAVDRIIKRNEIKPIHEYIYTIESARFELPDGTKVSIIIYANPDYH